MFRPGRVHPGGPKNQIKVPGKALLDRLNATRAWHLKCTVEAALQPYILNNFLGSAMLMQHFGPALGGQQAQLLRLPTKINRGRRQLNIKVDRLAFQFHYGKQHSLSLRRRVPLVNAQHQPGPFDIAHMFIVLSDCNRHMHALALRAISY